MAGKISFDEANLTIADIFLTIEEKEASCASVFESAADLYENLDKVDESEVFETRLKSLNNILGRGLEKGNTYVVAGRPAMGKSAFATSVFLPKAGSNQGVLFFSLEMTNKDLTARILSDLSFQRGAKITYKDIKNKKVDAFQARALIPCVESLKTIPFYIDECSEHTIVSLRAVIEEYIAKLKSQGKELACVVVDHIGLVTPDNRYSGNKTAETGAVSRALKIIAKDYNVAVVAVCQLNRGVEKQENKRPQLADLRWSGDIEQDATAVIGVYRDAYYNAENGGYEGTPNILEAIILKNRNGECETLQFYCSMAFNHISERL
jgi:replicative DNA helicase